MINETKKRDVRRNRRSLRVRKGVRGDAVKPRFSVFKSNKHLFAQLIDDEAGATLVSVGTMMEELQKQKLGRKSKAAAKQIGELIAERAKQKEIQTVVFDRGYYKYHGLLAEVANAAREAGLQF